MKLSRQFLAYLSILLLARLAQGNFTASQERILQDIYKVVVQDFHYRRHEWNSLAVRYAGFLNFFGTSWRLVTRLGGTYNVDSSTYYNRWNWNQALVESTDLLRDLERYHRAYRHLSWEGDKQLQAEWYRRNPRHWSDAVTFLDFMSSRSGRLHNTAGAEVPGYLANNRKQYNELLRLANSGLTECRSALANATRQLLDATVRIINLTSRQVDAMLYSDSSTSRNKSDSTNTSQADAAVQLVSITTEYKTVSGLVWDTIPALIANYSLSIGSTSCQNWTGPMSAERLASRANNISQAAASLGRQVLGHVLLYMQHYESRWSQCCGGNKISESDLANEQQRSALLGFYCRVLQEDIDKDLARHLETREMEQLTQLLGSCRQTTVSIEKCYSALADLWHQLRTRISREYSAFQQYSNRIPAILQVKSVMKVALPMVAVIGATLNFVIILYYARHTQERRIGRNFLIVLLACFDTSILVASNLVLFTDKYMEHDQELKPNGSTDLWCKFQAYLLNLTVESSAFTVVILSVERFLAVYSLFRHSTSNGARKELPLRQLAILSLCAFCFACIFNCMLIIGDEIAAPAKSTVGRQCVQYVRLQNFRANLAFVTLVKPVLNALARSILPYSLVCLLSLATCWLLFKKGAYQSLRDEEHGLQQQNLQQQQQQQSVPPSPLQQNQQNGQLSRAIGQLGLALAYLVLTAPAPVIYTLFMTAHADRLIVKLSNGLYDEVDPAFRTHWSRIGQLTVAQYATEYVLVPLSASINFWVFYITDKSFRLYVNSCLGCWACGVASARSDTEGTTAAMDAQEELTTSRHLAHGCSDDEHNDDENDDCYELHTETL